jgi:mannose/cellobiose epimerase-like protein (N-acyl-D-glucosamine 2-epimerase family)
MEWTAARLRRHLLEELLPYWAERGVDRQHGGFHNRLDGQGRPLPDDFKRLLVQARQIYAFSQGARLGAGRGALEIAARGVAFLEDAFRDRAHGGWFHTAAADGAPLDRRKDGYGHAFVVFGLVAYAAAGGETAALDLARETAELTLARLRDPAHGGYHEAADERWVPLGELPRRQNPHMHWLEALIALQRATPDPVWLEETDRLVALLESRWLDRSGAVLGEFFGADWSPLPGPEGQVVEPGHHYEWAWLLHGLAALRSHVPRPAAEALFTFAERFGRDADGGVFDRVDRSGRVLEGSKRLWPQTERLKALAARSEVGAVREALAHCFERYARGDGGWTEHLERNGTPRGDVQNATSVYHVVLALGEALEVLAT